MFSTTLLLSCYYKTGVGCLNLLSNRSAEILEDLNIPENFKLLSLDDSYIIGQNYNPEYTSEQLDIYNLHAENYCQDNELKYVCITDITRQDLTNPELVTNDNLHPCGMAYS